MMISDDADEHTGAASEQDPDSDSEATILLSQRMAKQNPSGERTEELNEGFDEELALHNQARDVHVTIDQFMMLPQSGHNVSGLVFILSMNIFIWKILNINIKNYMIK